MPRSKCTKTATTATTWTLRPRSTSNRKSSRASSKSKSRTLSLRIYLHSIHSCRPGASKSCPLNIFCRRFFCLFVYASRRGTRERCAVRVHSKRDTFLSFACSIFSKVEPRFLLVSTRAGFVFARFYRPGSHKTLRCKQWSRYFF